jgi:hypothetical protein
VDYRVVAPSHKLLSFKACSFQQKQQHIAALQTANPVLIDEKLASQAEIEARAGRMMPKAWNQREERTWLLQHSGSKNLMRNLVHDNPTIQVLSWRL